MGHLEGHSVIYWREVHPSLPQNQEGLLGDLVEDIQRENLLSVGMEEYLLHALNSSDGGVVTVSAFLGGLPGLSSEESKVGPSTEGPGGGFFSLVSLGGLLSVRGRVQLKAGNDPWWSLSLLPLIRMGWVL